MVEPTTKKRLEYIIGGKEMDFLKEILGEELFEQVTEKLGGKKLGIVNDGSWIPKAKFDEVNEAKKKLEAALEELKANGASAEELQKTIENYKKELRNVKINYELKSKLREHKAKYEDLLLGKFDLEKIVIGEDGKISGIDEQLASLKENYADLFVVEEEKPKVTGKTPEDKGKSKDPEKKDPFLEGFMKGLK